MTLVMFSPPLSSQSRSQQKNYLSFAMLRPCCISYSVPVSFTSRNSIIMAKTLSLNLPPQVPGLHLVFWYRVCQSLHFATATDLGLCVHQFPIFWVSRAEQLLINVYIKTYSEVPNTSVGMQPLFHLGLNTELTLTQMQTEPSRFPSPQVIAIWKESHCPLSKLPIQHQQSFFPLGLTVIWLLLENTLLLLPHALLIPSHPVYTGVSVPLFLRATPWLSCKCPCPFEICDNPPFPL